MSDPGWLWIDKFCQLGGKTRLEDIETYLSGKSEMLGKPRKGVVN